MNLKKLKTLDIFIIFGLCFLTHFLYTWLPNSLFSIFFPVNESIWEHMKMLFSAIILCGLIDYFLIKKFDINSNNLIFSTFITGIISVPLFLLIYLPIYNLIGENMFINLITLFITIYFVEIIGYFIMSKEGNNILNIIGIIGIIISYIIFGILTYNPPKNDLFLDTTENKYGINIYAI